MMFQINISVMMTRAFPKLIANTIGHPSICNISSTSLNVYLVSKNF